MGWDASTAFDIFAECSLNQLIGEATKRAHTHTRSVVQHYYHFSFATCDFPNVDAGCAIWTNEYRLPMFFLSFRMHIPLLTFIAWQRVTCIAPDFKRAHSRFIIFPRIVSANNKWTWSELLLPAPNTTTYIFFIRTIMICAAILLANFCSHRHFLALRALLVYSRRSQLYKRIREHRMQRRP